MKNVYKKPLPLEQQVDYLEKNKKVVFKNITKSDAEKILYEHCYINVITPFKHVFARIDPATGSPAKDAFDNHIYDKSTDFNDYYSIYKKERGLYNNIFKNIMDFETTFNSIVAYEVLSTYSIDSFEKFMKFRDSLMVNASALKINEKVREHMQDEINSFYSVMKRYDDIYIFLDRLSLSQLITVYRCVDKRTHNRIFKGLLKANATFGYSSPGTFDDFLKRIVPIRNCVCHFNSLEILTNYYDIKTKALRTEADKRRYKTVIGKLSS